MDRGIQEFTWDGKKYTVRLDGCDQYPEKYVRFPVLQCPNCKMLNRPDADRCEGCSSPLEGLEPTIAYRTERTGRRWLITLGILAVVDTLFALLFKARFGAILTALTFAGAYWLAGNLSGTCVKTDDQMTVIYRMYLKSPEYQREKAEEE